MMNHMHEHPRVSGPESNTAPASGRRSRVTRLTSSFTAKANAPFPYGYLRHDSDELRSDGEEVDGRSDGSEHDLEHDPQHLVLAGAFPIVARPGRSVDDPPDRETDDHGQQDELD